MTHTRHLLGRSLGIFSSVALLSGGLAPIVIAHEAAPTRVLTVTGTATVSVPTTITRVRLAIDVQAKNAADVQAQVAEDTAAVVNLLRSRSVERMQTTGIQLQPVYERNTEQPELVGYRGSNSVAFRIETSQAGGVIDDAIQAGATRIDGVEFLATEPELEQAKLEALQLATQNAQQKADVVLSALGLSTQEIITINIGQTHNASPIQSNALVRSSPSSPIVGGDSTVQGNVTLKIRY